MKRVKELLHIVLLVIRIAAALAQPLEPSACPPPPPSAGEVRVILL